MHLQDHNVRAPLDLFHRTYHSLLRSTGEIQIQALAEQYAAFEPSLHQHVRASEPDLAALTYTSLRLPACIDAVRLVLTMKDGSTIEEAVEHATGSPDNPLNDDRLAEKYMTLASETLGERDAAALLDRLWHLEDAGTIAGLVP